MATRVRETMLQQGCTLDGLFDPFPPAVKVVKPLVLRFLSVVIRKFRQENCYGCSVEHPSQLQHQCLEVMPEYFLYINHRKLVFRVLKKAFPDAVRQVILSEYPTSSFHLTDKEIYRLGEAFLYDLLYARDIENEIIQQGEVLDSIHSIDNSVMESAEKLWNTPCKPESDDDDDD